MLGKLSIILVPNSLKLLFLFTVLVDLGLELTRQFLDSSLQLLHLRLLKVEHLLLILSSLVLIDFLGGHLVNFRSKLIQLGFGQGDLFTAVSLLLLELYWLLLLLLHLLLGIHLLTNHAGCLILEKAGAKHTHNVLLFG